MVTASQMRGRRAAPVAFALIAINAAIYLLGQIDPELGRRMFADGAQHPALIDAGEWWRAITAVFLHGSLTHVLFNMWALYLFGPALEIRFGSAAFGAMYLAAGLGGSAAYHLVGREAFAVGASGAIFGLMGALLASTYRQRHTPAGRAVFSQLTMLLAINLLIPAIVPNVAWEAHLGGLLAGALIASGWDRLPISGPGATTRRVAVAGVVAVVAIVIILL